MLQQTYRELVLDPAGMADTWLESSNEAPRRREIASHDFDGHDITDMDPTVDWAGGGLVSTRLVASAQPGRYASRMSGSTSSISPPPKAARAAG